MKHENRDKAMQSKNDLIKRSNSLSIQTSLLFIFIRVLYIDKRLINLPTIVNLLQPCKLLA